MSRENGFISTQGDLTFRTSDAAFTIYVESFAKLRTQSLDLKARIEEARKRHGIALASNSKDSRQTVTAARDSYEEGA